MAWNEPGNNGKDRDPWGNNGKNQGPPDLDEMLRKVSRRFGGLLGGGKSGGGDTSNTPPAHYTPASSLKANCPLPYITTEAELDEWLAALRKAAKAELQKGNRISL